MKKNTIVKKDKKVTNKKINKVASKTSNKNKNINKKVKSSVSLLASPRGMHDLLPEDLPIWNKVKNSAYSISEFYEFSRIETPVLEKLELFVRGVGEKTDIVGKEMFTLSTKGGDKLALRPEYTAPIIRSFLQHGMKKRPQPQKLYYFGPLFRHERPQSGRYRQFHQFGLEVVGGESYPVYDAQVMLMFYKILEELKLKDLIIHINSIGCRSCRPGYIKKLIAYYKGKNICKDCSTRVKDNPLRLLDCKKDNCKNIKAEAPSILDSICSLCRQNLKHVLEYIEELDLPYMIDPYLVRGLDYYSRVVFEIFSGDNDLALVAGGRYDYLAELLGGRSTSAVGGAMGIERVFEILKDSNPESLRKKQKCRVFLVHIGELAKKKNLPILEEFRRNNITIASSLGKHSLSAQLEKADKIGAQLALIIGQKEVYEDCVIIRNMETGVQESVPIEKVIEIVKKRLRS